jgi:hypothetical protein
VTEVMAYDALPECPYCGKVDEVQMVSALLPIAWCRRCMVRWEC